MTQGLSLDRCGRQTRLKWHRLRRSLADPEFGAAVMAEGFRIGASMELDLRVRADGGFVVLHDATLARETNGSGRVRGMDVADLAALHYRESGAPLMMSETLAASMPSAHPSAVLQFDMKDDMEAIGPRGLDHLADLFGESRAPVIFSGGSADLMRALAERLPQLPRGIDPTDRLVVLARARGVAALVPALIAELRGGAAPEMCYLNWRLVLQVKAQGLDLVALCHAEGVEVDLWTHTLKAPAKGFSDTEWRDVRAMMALGPDQITTDEAVATEAAWLARRAVEVAHV